MEFSTASILSCRLFTVRTRVHVSLTDGWAEKAVCGNRRGELRPGRSLHRHCSSNLRNSSIARVKASFPYRLDNSRGSHVALQDRRFSSWNPGRSSSLSWASSRCVPAFGPLSHTCSTRFQIPRKSPRPCSWPGRTRTHQPQRCGCQRHRLYEPSAIPAMRTSGRSSFTWI